MRVAIYGRGKVGLALARALREAGVEVSLRPGRASPKAALDARTISILAVPDAHLAALASRLTPFVSRSSVVLHCAGALDARVLSACAERGAAVAGFHPLVSFASRHKLTSLEGVVFVATGDAKATRAAKRIAAKVSARCVVQPILGPAYHAAAALLANGGAALAFSALGILTELGMSEADAARGLSGLLQSVAFNIKAVGLPLALTGPVARGDTATVARHLRALRALSPARAREYRAVQPLIRACAEAQRAAHARQRQR